MAVAAVTVTTVQELPMLGDAVLVVGTLAIAPAADTYATNGLALGEAEFRNKGVLIAGRAPNRMICFGKAGYHYEYNEVTDKLIVRTGAAAAAPLTEMANALAIPAALSGDVINFWALFNKLG